MIRIHANYWTYNFSVTNGGGSPSLTQRGFCGRALIVIFFCLCVRLYCRIFSDGSTCCQTEAYVLKFTSFSPLFNLHLVESVGDWDATSEMIYDLSSPKSTLRMLLLFLFLISGLFPCKLSLRLEVNSD